METYAINSRPTPENARSAPKGADGGILPQERQKEQIPRKNRLVTVERREFEMPEILEIQGILGETRTGASLKKMNHCRKETSCTKFSERFGSRLPGTSEER